MADTFVPVTFVPDELLTSTKMNVLSANQAAFHDGTGLADGSIVARHIGLTKTVDSNGWTVYDYGSWKSYQKRVTFANNQVSALNVFPISSTNLPVGIPNLSTVFVRYAVAIGGQAGILNVMLEVNQSSQGLFFTAGCLDGGSRSFSGFIDLEVLA